LDFEDLQSILNDDYELDKDISNINFEDGTWNESETATIYIRYDDIPEVKTSESTPKENEEDAINNLVIKIRKINETKDTSEVNEKELEKNMTPVIVELVEKLNLITENSNENNEISNVEYEIYDEVQKKLQKDINSKKIHYEEISQIYVKKKPFNFGAERLAYLMFYNGTPYVLKLPKRRIRGLIDNDSKIHVQIIDICERYLTIFNDRLGLKDCFITFVSINMIRLRSREHQLYGVMEKFLTFKKGGTDFVKFNSNTQAPYDAKAKIIQAFSHFTFELSEHEFVIVDLQGVNNYDIYHISDPSIQSKIEGKYGLTDRGEEGIRDYFAVHQCNKYCKNLGLPINQPQNTFTLESQEEI